MVKVFEKTDKEFYMDGYHKDNLDVAKKVIQKDWDMIFVYDGYEGTGKSVKAMQDAFYCDPTLDLTRIVFNPNDFEDAVDKADKYQAIVYDEAYGGLSSRGAMGTVNKSIIQKLTVIREKNLFIFIVLPSFFDLDKYVALWRSRALIHVYSAEGFERGYFAFYNKDMKKDLYVLGKKFYDYRKAKPNFTGRFINYYPIDEIAYRKKKRETSLNLEDDNRIVIINIARKIKQDIVRGIKEKGLGLTQKQIAEIMGVTTMTIHNYLKRDDNTHENGGVEL